MAAQSLTWINGFDAAMVQLPTAGAVSIVCTYPAVSLPGAFTAADETEAQRYPEGRQRQRFLQRRLLLRHLFARQINCSPADVVVAYDANGRPCLADQNPPLYLSIAHRGDVIAYAFAPSPSGIDVEIMTAAQDLPWNVLHPREREMLSTMSEAPRHEAFLRLWTLKEAYLKALGVGLAREPSEICVLADEGRVLDQGRSVSLALIECREERIATTRAVISCVMLA
jgi:phosphopantetheinyl transferase